MITADAIKMYANDSDTSDNHEPNTPNMPSPGIDISLHSVFIVELFLLFACSPLGAML